MASAEAALRTIDEQSKRAGSDPALARQLAQTRSQLMAERQHMLVKFRTLFFHTLASQRRMEIDAVSSIRPVVQEGCGVQHIPEIVPGADLCPFRPPLLRHELAISVRRLIPGQPQVARRGDQSSQRDRENGQRDQPQSFRRVGPRPQCLSIFSRMS